MQIKLILVSNGGFIQVLPLAVVVEDGSGVKVFTIRSGGTSPPGII
ncbi:MAG TPA: hypothetical protein PKN71_05230 [Bacillota bacterium]|jgi:hypothetical protein|nr:hypothetical protein [Bacillota bacterium]HPZ22275.1 hypothetical protein [Bacillota bacterium]